MSGSLREPARGLTAQVVQQGLVAAGLPSPVDPLALLAAVGDPMQVLAAGLLLELAPRRVPVLLAGGSQMAAVLAVALALATAEQRPALVASCLVATTAWVAEEPGSDLARLLQLIGAGIRWNWPRSVMPTVDC